AVEERIEVVNDANWLGQSTPPQATEMRSGEYPVWLHTPAMLLMATWTAPATGTSGTSGFVRSTISTSPPMTRSTAGSSMRSGPYRPPMVTTASRFGASNRVPATTATA